MLENLMLYTVNDQNDPIFMLLILGGEPKFVAEWTPDLEVLFNIMNPDFPYAYVPNKEVHLGPNHAVDMDLVRTTTQKFMRVL